MLRVLVCGGRNYADRQHVFNALDSFHGQRQIGLLIQGGATGADALAYEWARERQVPALSHFAEWDKHGKPAGPIRNSAMLTQWKPQVLIAFPGDWGTNDMTKKATAAGLEIIRSVGGEG